MILDSFKLSSVIFQIQYSEGYEIWDHAGAISRKLCNIWPDLKFSKARPEQQILTGKGVTTDTTLQKATITLLGEKSLDQRKIDQLTETFEVWRDLLKLDDLKRVSTRAIYIKELPSLKEANAEQIALNIARWPSGKVFDQPIESEKNGFELRYRFEDDNSFSILTLKTEQVIYEVELDPNFIEDSEHKVTKNRVVIDFDRGLLGSVKAAKFRMEDWIKGYQHILRRDIEKVIMG